MVKFNDTEKKIIDSPYFQRLRRIKQLGLAHLVFPGAMHTRFSHSIGTFAIAQKVASVLSLNKEEEKNLRMAALLHDIGHFPLSHTIEEVYSNLITELILKVQKKKLKNGNQTDENPMQIPILPKGVNLHEEIGSQIIKNTELSGILQKEGFNPTEISLIITGQHPDIKFNQLMHSDLDIDQMDYLIRDAKNAGITYSTCDIEYLISNMRADSDIIFFDLKALRALEHYFLAHYFYFTQILFHKTRSVIEYCARKVYRTAIEDEINIFNEPIPTIHTLSQYVLTKNYYYFDDNYFEVLLREISSEKIQKYKQVISYRKIPALYYEKLVLNDSSSDDNSRPKEDEIIIIEEKKILDDLKKIRMRNACPDSRLVYEDSKAVRLLIPNKYDYEPKVILLCQFQDTVLQRLLDFKFKILRRYRFRD